MMLEPLYLAIRPGIAFSVPHNRVVYVTLQSPTSWNANGGSTATTFTGRSSADNFIVQRSADPRRSYDLWLDNRLSPPTRCPLDRALYAERRSLPAPRRERLALALRSHECRPGPRLAIALPRRLI